MFNCVHSHIFQNPDGLTTNLAEVLRYPIPTKDVMRNKARAATAWFGDFTEKVMTFPEYEMFTKTPGWMVEMVRPIRIQICPKNPGFPL